jgi:hypothetical protein
VAIPRLHLFELEDQPWFPAVVRDLATDYLQFVQARFHLHRAAGHLLAGALRATGSERVVDLCSGGGGPVAALSEALAADGVQVVFTLTDRFPNLQAFRRRAEERPGAIAFAAEAVDARAVPDTLRGFRTLFNAFHHFRPAEGAAVLGDAVRARQPIGIFEIPDRTAGTLLPILVLTPLMVLLATPFIRPVSWGRLIWTYIVPLVPLTCWWDGVVSQLRAYTPAELEELTRALPAGYRWHSGKVPLGSAPGALTYLLGYPEGSKP